MTLTNGHVKYVLAIDLGSSGPKVGLLASDGRLIASARRATTTLFLPNDGAEQDPQQWWDTISDAVRELMADHPVRPEDIVAVGCTSCWSVIVPVDADGNHLMNAVHWLDGRGARYTAAVTDGLIKIQGYEIRKLFKWLRVTGGVPLDSGADSLAHILFIKNERPNVYAKTHKFLEPADYINLKLTGKFAASAATIFPLILTDNRDPLRIHYDDTLLKWTSIDRDKLPDLRPVDAVLGPILPGVAKAWGLAENTKVAMGTCDNTSAVLGAGATEDYQGYFNIGTTSWVSCHVPFKKTDLFTFIATMPAAIPGRNVVVAEQRSAGRCLEALAKQWLFADADWSAPEKIYARAEQMAVDTPAGSDGLLFLPWLGGAGPPVEDKHARGGFLNQSLRTNRSHAVRAVLEGIAYNQHWLVGYIEKFIGRRFDTLHAVGTGGASDLWCQIHADVMNRPIRQVADARQGTLRGAGLAAFIALGILQRKDIPNIVKIEKTFEPNPANRAVYDQLFAEFVNAYKANKRIFARLNRNPKHQRPLDKQ
jgi:xylulokinase